MGVGHALEVVALTRVGKVDKGVTKEVAPTVLGVVTGPVKAEEKVGGGKAEALPTHAHLGCACRQNLQ